MILSTLAKIAAREAARRVAREAASHAALGAARGAARRAADPEARRAAAQAARRTAERIARRTAATGAGVVAGIGAGLAARAERRRDDRAAGAAGATRAARDPHAAPAGMQGAAAAHGPSTMDDDTTHFGYRTVGKGQKATLVGEVFDSVAPSYDVMNDLMSFGIHRLWKRFAMERSGARPGQRVLDIAGGTGDLAEQLARRVGSGGHVLLADINAAMLRAGRERLVDAGIAGNVDYAQSDAEALPFADDTFDCVTIAFGLRNVTDKARALGSMHRVLKPGGRLLVLEFSKPVLPLLARAYDAYSFTALPLLGKLVANDAESYRYLAESIRVHPDQEALSAMLETAGFERVAHHNLTGGIVALHVGFKL